jgi:chromosome partitioning protein
VARIAINRVRANTTIGKGVREVLVAAGLSVLRTELGDRVAYQEALAAGRGVTTYEPKGMAATEVRALYDELFEQGEST